ncbi:hypothetical protein Q9966_016685 [Columba livia]|nr:hypothetical protein Q9966_016685 [Columba livia]
MGSRSRVSTSAAGPPGEGFLERGTQIRSSCPQAANVQQQLHHPVPPPAVHRHTGAAALALLALPGHLPGCPPGQRPHHHHHSLGPAPPHPHVLLPAQPRPL